MPDLRIDGEEYSTSFHPGPPISMEEKQEKKKNSPRELSDGLIYNS